MTATQTVRDFFDAYRDHDVEGMVDLCRDDAEFSSVPVELWGRQRVVRGDGWVRTVGKVLWTGLIDAFPDLTNRLTSLTADGDGNVAAEVVLSGTQARDWGTVGNRGLRKLPGAECGRRRLYRVRQAESAAAGRPLSPSTMAARSVW